MNIKNNFVTIASLVVVVIALGLGSVLMYNATRAPIEEENIISTEEVALKNGTLVVEGVIEEIPYVAKADASVLAILLAITEGRQIMMATKDYGTLGTLVVAIGQFENGTDNKYWHYTVNDTIPTVGADAYIPKEGDTIKWIFSATEF